jgi:hypothetical protein
MHPRPPIILALAFALAAIPLAGCGKARFKEERSSAERQLSAAETDEADPETLAFSRDSIALARSIEERALADIDSAKKEGEAAKQWANEASARRSIQAERLGRVEERLAAARKFNPAMRKAEIETLERTRDTLRRQLQLSDLEGKHADTGMRNATAREEAAEQRLQLARQLYLEAEQQAKTAQIEALAKSRDATDQKLKK